MLINKGMKENIARPNVEYMNRMAAYMPHRAKATNNLKTQLANGCSSAESSETIMDTSTKANKSRDNIKAMITSAEKSKMLPPPGLQEAYVLRNPFIDRNATPTQQIDLLRFRQLGQQEFERLVQYKYLRVSSVPSAPTKRQSLQTFAEIKASKRQVTSLQKEKARVTKCMRRRLLWSQKAGTPYQLAGEQFIELPRALAMPDGTPHHSTKASATNFYEGRYGNSVVTNRVPTSPFEAVTIEGMFLIYINPLGKKMVEYVHFLMRHFIMPYFNRGTKEVHIIFDQPGRLLQHPKSIERDRRLKANPVPSTHEHLEFNDTVISKKWNDILSCAVCKRNLVVYIGECLLRASPVHLQAGQTLCVAGAGDGDAAWAIDDSAIEREVPQLLSNAEEGDTRVWLHTIYLPGHHNLILSPDTDVYHIGLSIPQLQHKRIYIQLSKNGAPLRLLCLNDLVQAFNQDPALMNIAEHERVQAIQALYVLSGSDFTSYFKGIGKTSFLKAFFNHADFICAATPQLPGLLGDKDEQGSGLLAFLRLVGCIYFCKHKAAFDHHTTPASLLHSISGSSPLQKHIKWLENMREIIWARIDFEDEMIPSFEALRRHWLRSIWVIDYWRQATNNEIVLRPVQQYGWKLTSGQLEIDWDSDENIRHIQEKVRLLLRGCTCKTGCTSNRCKCKKSGNCCMPGCKCINCKNLPNDSSPPPLNDNPTPLPNDNPPPLTNNTLSDDSDDNSSDSDTDFESFLYHNL